MKRLRTAVMFALVALVAASGFSALSPQYVEFGKGPAKWIMTKAEAAAWAKISTDAEAQKFIDLFWAKRDPSPATPVNEARDAFNERVRLANERYSSSIPGSMTDQGHVFILLGSPTRIRTSGNQPSSKILTGPAITSGRPDLNAPDRDNVQGYSPKQIWVYERGKTVLDLGVPVAEFAFVDQYGDNQWKMERTGRTDFTSLFERAANQYLTQPSLTEAPKMIAQAPAAPAAPAGPGSFKTDAIRSAVEDVRTGKAEGSKALFLTYGEFITPEGEYFVPVSLFAPKAAGYAEGAYTFFGYIEKDGQPALIFEEDANLAASKEDLFLDKSLELAPGSYKATFGLAQAGKPLAIMTTPLELKGLDKDAATVSNLILSNNIYALSQAQAPTDPFAFGGMKVIPKSDRRFTNADELWYFFELRNPGIAEGVTAPTVKVKTTITGKTATGQTSKMSAPIADVPAQELKGVPNHWVVGQSIPLTKFRAGDYTMDVKVTDPVKNVTYDLQGTFTVVASPAPAAAPASN